MTRGGPSPRRRSQADTCHDGKAGGGLGGVGGTDKPMTRDEIARHAEVVADHMVRRAGDADAQRPRHAPTQHDRTGDVPRRWRAVGMMSGEFLCPGCHKSLNVGAKQCWHCAKVLVGFVSRVSDARVHGCAHGVGEPSGACGKPVMPRSIYCRAHQDRRGNDQ